MLGSAAIGMIEVIGFPAAIECADAALKSANIELIGYELSKGPGKVTVKFCGSSGAVQAAVEAGCAAAEKVGEVAARLVIMRPHKDLEKLILSPETVLAIEHPQDSRTDEEAAEAPDTQAPETDAEGMGRGGETDTEETPPPCKPDEEPEPLQATCNICGDPACSRHKGESHTLCIHYHDSLPAK